MKKDPNTNVKIKYTIDKRSFFGHSAVMLMAMSAIFRIIGCWGMWSDPVFAVMHILIPVVSCLLLILCISLLGKKGFFLSCIPVILGVIFFIYKSFSFESRIHMVLCILLYLAVAIIYTGTVVGSIPTKWLLPPLFGLPFLYHVFVEDLPALSNTAVPVSFSAGMQEMSVLCIMAALFCVGMGLKKVVLSTETVIVAEPAMPETAFEAPAAPEVKPAVTEPVPAAEAGMSEAHYEVIGDMPAEPILPENPESPESVNEK